MYRGETFVGWTSRRVKRSHRLRSRRWLGLPFPPFFLGVFLVVRRIIPPKIATAQEERRHRNFEMFDGATIFAIAGTFLLAGAVKGEVERICPHLQS